MTRDQAILMEHIGGDSFRKLGAHHGLSAMRCHAIYRAETTRHVNEVLLQMWLAQKCDQLLVLAVPDGLADDQAAAIRYLDWLLHEFAELGEDIHVHYRPTLTGAIAFALEDRRLTKLMEENR